MFNDEAGVLLAILIWLWLLVYRIAAINSRMARNLALIGQRVAWTTAAPAPALPADRSKLLRACGLFAYEFITLALTLTGWLYVVVAVGFFVYMKAKDAGAPQVIREFRWKLRNQSMTFDELVRELMKVAGDPPEKFEQVRSEVLDLVERHR